MRRFVFFFLLVVNLPLRGQQLTLPFFDDFSSPQINPSYWMVGGVERTVGKAVRPPSIGVISFDGRNAQGVPYRLDQVNAVGSTDTLTIREVSLAQYSLRDSLFLRFFVQPNGLGEAPDPEDSLWVEAKTKEGEWVRVWSLRGGTASPDFRAVAIALNQEAFFFDGFQFRFRASGRQSGAFDTWHVDYVYLATQGTSSPLFYPDIALVDPPRSLLKLYRGVPFRSFSQNPQLYLRDSLEVTVRNFREFISFSQVTFSLEGPDRTNSFSPTDFQTIPGSGFVSRRYPRPSSWVPSQAGLYRYKVALSTPESTTSSVPDFTGNDAFDYTLSLENTWQYDDGSAEGGADIDRRLGQVALLFSMGSADTLGGVQFVFSPTFSSLRGRSVLVRVWEATPEGPGRLLHQEPLRISSDSAFVNLFFQQSVLVPAQFYLGWQRLAEQVVPVGLDKNSVLPANHIWSNTGLGWQQTSLSGALMIRAVMGTLGKAVNDQQGDVTQVRPEFDFRVFPNPAQDWLFWAPTSGQFLLRNAAGQILTVGSAEVGRCAIQDLPAGVYFLTIVSKTHTFTQKWVLDR